MMAVYRAGIAHLRGESTELLFPDIDAILVEAASVVQERHAALHDPEGDQWIDPTWSNPTIYQYGYLLRSDELCFWHRERAKLTNLIAGSVVESVPGCAL